MPLDLKKLMGDQDHIGENLRAYMQTFWPAARDIFEITTQKTILREQARPPPLQEECKFPYTVAKNNHRRLIVALFNFTKAQRWLDKRETTAADALGTVKVKDADVQIIRLRRWAR